MRFGVHVPISDGLERAVQKAAAMGCEAMQIFSSNPRSWTASSLDPAAASKFRALLQARDIHPVCLHTPYLVNLAAPDEEILRRSRESVKNALLRAQVLGARFVVSHIGAHKGTGLENGIGRVVESIAGIMGAADHAVTLLLENTPGSGSEIGRSFDDFAAILDALPALEQRLGICLDTAHLWGAGYDISTASGVDETLKALAARIGMSRLRLIHANDSSARLSSHHDIHQPLGKGLIGLDAFAALVNHPRLQEMPFILETRTQDIDAVAKELNLIRSLHIVAA